MILLLFLGKLLALLVDEFLLLLWYLGTLLEKINVVYICCFSSYLCLTVPRRGRENKKEKKMFTLNERTWELSKIKHVIIYVFPLFF